MREPFTPPLSARTHACDCTTQDPGLTPHLLRLKQADRPPQWHDLKGGATSRLHWVWQEPSAMRLEFRPSVRQQAPSTFQSCVQTSSCPSLAADAAHQRRDKAASSCSQSLLQELHRIAATKDVTPIIDKSPERRSRSQETVRRCVCILVPQTRPSSICTAAAPDRAPRTHVGPQRRAARQMATRPGARQRKDIGSAMSRLG